MRDRARQLRELTRLFFARFLENDLICIDGDTRASLVGVISLLVSPGVFVPFLEYLQFGSAPLVFKPWWVRDMAALPDKVLHVALSMTVLGLFTIFEWDAILPDRRDLAVLRPLPVGLGTMFAARACALVGFWLVLTLALDGVSAWFFPAAVIQNGSLALLGWYIRCHVLALLAGNLFLFLLLIGIQGLLMTALGWARFRRVAPYAQFVLIVAILGMFFSSIGLGWGANPKAPPAPLMGALPPWWFVGLEQAALGWRMPLFDHLARVVPWALGAAGLLSALGYALSYRRCLARAFEEEDGPVSRPGGLRTWLGRMADGFLLPDAVERAVFYFVWHTVTRCRTHRMLVAAWAGAGFALVLQGITGALASGRHRWWEDMAGPLLPVPVVLPVFLVTGLRYAFTVPSDLRANYVFQVGVVTDAKACLAGARKAALLLEMLPVVFLLAPLFVALWGWMTGGLHVLFGAVSAWLLVEAQLAGLEKIPFTCSFVPGKANLKTMWTFYVIGYLVYVGLMCWIDLKILQHPARMAGFLIVAAAVWRWIVSYRERREAAGFRLLFDERAEPVVCRLELQQ